MDKETVDLNGTDRRRMGRFVQSVSTSFRVINSAPGPPGPATVTGSVLNWHRDYRRKERLGSAGHVTVTFLKKFQDFNHI